MDNPTEFYRKKLQLYVDARDSLARAITALTLIQKIEDRAPGRDEDEIVEIENHLENLEMARDFSEGLADALAPYIVTGG